MASEVTNDPARALLERLVEWYDEMPGYGSIGVIASDARALLAESECAGPFVDAHACPKCGPEIRARKPTPRSRAEAEAMVDADRWDWSDTEMYLHPAGDWVPYERVAALLAALTREDK